MSRCPRMLIAVLAFCSIMLFAPPAMAQQEKSDDTPDIETLVNDKDLKLTDQQKNQLKTINEQRKKDIQTIQQDSSLTREQKMQRIREINKATNEQIRGTLTSEQYQRWQRRQRDRRKDVRDRREDKRDRKEDVRDRREDRRDRRRRP
ncbi:MAG TPA: hypothetical protein VNL38_00490 [Candidatus Nitrosotenuis sp.]|nr:hypothetical protein [Candidatus Nitrosotenuis sp.]